MTPARLLVVLLIVFVVLSGLNSLYSYERAGAIVANAPSPSVRPTRCWIYSKLYPATTQVFKSQRLTPTQQHEIKIWAAAVSSLDQPLVRWMRDPYHASHVLVMVADSQQIWTVLNEQYIINHVDCWVRGDMAPRIYPSGTYPP